MFAGFDFGILWANAPFLWNGVLLTLQLTALAVLQSGSLAAYVGDFSDDITRQVALNIQIPLLDIGAAIIGEHSAVPCANPQPDAGQRPERGASRQVETIGKRIIDGGGRSAITINADDHIALAVVSQHA